MSQRDSRAPRSPGRRDFLRATAGAVTLAGQPLVHAAVSIPSRGGSLVAGMPLIEGSENPLGIDVVQPRLSWSLTSTERGARQHAFRILVASTAEKLARGDADLWDSGRVEGGTTAHVAYAGRALNSRQRCHAQVQVWGQENPLPVCTPAATWEMGLLHPADWRGKWIGQAGKAPQPAPLLRRAFAVRAPVVSARLYVAGVGYHVAYLNGRRIGDHLLDPACTRYDRRVLYVTHDVTAMIETGDNVLGVELGRGFFGLTTKTAWQWNEAPWHGEPRALLQLDIVFADGSRQVVASDERWRRKDGPTRFDSLYAGESYDARLADENWSSPRFDDSDWAAASVMPAPEGRLVAQALPPIRCMQRIATHTVDARPSRRGTYVFDFGRTVSGAATLAVEGKRGTALTLSYAQQRKADGSVNLDQGYVHGGRFQQDEYILAGRDQEIWTPEFSHKSFRYVEVAGLPAPPSSDLLTAQEWRSSVPVTAGFSCSHDIYNRIHAMVQRSIGHHLMGIPAVDPMYEKIGWLADAQLNAPGIAINFGTHMFLAKWLDDIADCQTPEGNLPVIVPSGGWGYPAQSTEWKAAYPIVMWEVHRRFGDVRVLRQHVDRVARYLAWEYSKRDTSGLAKTDLGDWLAPGGFTQPPEDTRLSATAYLYRAFRILADSFTVLGRHDDASRAKRTARALSASFNAAFLDRERGHYRTASDPGLRQTSQALPLAFGLVPDDMSSRVAAALVADIRQRGCHLNTGALGTAVLLPVLTQAGYSDVAHAVASQEDFPSWGFWLANGADTLWETWELQQSGQGRPPSHDHYLFGSIDAWFFEHLAGITPLEPGYARFRVAPQVEGPVRWMETWMQTTHGKITSRWERNADGFVLALDVPANTTARVELPKEAAGRVLESDRDARRQPGILLLPDGAWLVAAGQYRFTTAMPRRT